MVQLIDDFKISGVNGVRILGNLTLTLSSLYMSTCLSMWIISSIICCIGSAAGLRWAAPLVHRAPVPVLRLWTGGFSVPPENLNFKAMVALPLTPYPSIKGQMGQRNSKG